MEKLDELYLIPIALIKHLIRYQESSAIFKFTKKIKVNTLHNNE